MNLRITDIIFVDYLNCSYKAYLKIHGKNGRKTDFEIMQNRLSNEYRTSAIDFLKNRWKKDKILGDSSLSQFRKGNYRKGINIRERVEEFDVLCDGIIKEPKSSDEFVPIVFINKDNLAITDKLCLAFCGVALGTTLKIMPSFGRIIYGSEHSGNVI